MEEFVEIGIDYENQRAIYYLTQHRNSNNSPITTKIIASKPSYNAVVFRRIVLVWC
jgi:hypothetical protein